MKFLQLSFMNFVGEELTVFGFLKEECEKNFLRTTGLDKLAIFIQRCYACLAKRKVCFFKGAKFLSLGL